MSTDMERRCRCVALLLTPLHAEAAAALRLRVVSVVRTMFDARFRGGCVVRLLVRTRVRLLLLLLLVRHDGGGLRLEGRAVAEGALWQRLWLSACRGSSVCRYPLSSTCEVDMSKRMVVSRDERPLHCSRLLLPSGLRASVTHARTKPQLRPQAQHHCEPAHTSAAPSSVHWAHDWTSSARDRSLSPFH